MPRLFLNLRLGWNRNGFWLFLLSCLTVCLVLFGFACCLQQPVDEGEFITHVPTVSGFVAGAPALSTDAEDFGWAGPAAVQDMAPWADAQPKFELTDELGQRIWQDNESANVRLWQMVAHAGGEYPNEAYQETGDCTSWGTADAIVNTQGGQAHRGDPIEIKRPFQPFTYGAGRVWIWAPQIGGARRLPGAGCTGAAVAKASQEFGVVPYGTPGLPEYSGSLADTWGRKGPPEELKAIAAKHKVRTVSRITSIAEARGAICNYYAFTIASDWGNPKGKYQKLDGRLVGKRTGVWNHQMCVNGYDGSASSGRKYFHIQNSWPISQHPTPIDDSPAGGFWIEDEELEYILAAGDSWAYSDFEGFPARNTDLDFSPLKPKPR